jgi:hypothetical protein
VTEPGSTHHHGILAGLGAGTAAVILAGVLVLAVWRNIAGQASVAVEVIVWALTAAVVGAVAAGFAFAFLWIRHRARHPETLTRATVRAEVTGPAAAREIPAAAPVAELAPGPAWRLNSHVVRDHADPGNRT